MSDVRLGRTARSKAFRYDAEIELDSPSTHAKIVRLVGSDKRVLELGCATGYMSKALRAAGCRVVAVEIDEKAAAQAEEFCERVIVGDLDELDLEHVLDGEAFDVVVAGDVLEHLKDPSGVLLAVRRCLKRNGFVVASVPNVAHASLRLALLGGSFQYAEIGLLDRTHLHFYTYESLQELFEGTGYAIAHLERQEKALETSEVTYDRTAVPPQLVEKLGDDRTALTYQFIVVAHPLPRTGMARVQRRMRELAEENESARREIDELGRAARERDVLAHRCATLEQELANYRNVAAARAALGRRLRKTNRIRQAAVAALELAVQERDELAGSLRETGDREVALESELARLRAATEAQRETGLGRDELALTIERLERRESSLRTMLVEARDELVRYQQQLEAALPAARERDVLAHQIAALETKFANYQEIAAARDAHARRLIELNDKRRAAVAEVEALRPVAEERDYLELRLRIRDVVEAVVPRNAVVAVTSKGDDALLELGKRTGQHFPSDQIGAHAGHHPADGAAAIAHVESLRRQGAQFLLFPATELWWLDHYSDLRRHLEKRYSLSARKDGVCVIFDLRKRRYRHLLGLVRRERGGTIDPADGTTGEATPLSGSR